jgi:hypothetical protein
MVAKLNGTIKRPPDGRGFFFISGDNGIDYFCLNKEVGHRSVTKLVGLRVRFTPTDVGRGPRATELEFLDPDLVGNV